MLSTERRRVYKSYDNQWIEVSFDSLRKGDVFKMYEPYDEINPVMDKDGKTIFTAKTDAFGGSIQI